MKTLRHTVAPGARAGMVVDAILCFVALLLAASTLTSRYASVPPGRDGLESVSDAELLDLLQKSQPH